MAKKKEIENNQLAVNAEKNKANKHDILFMRLQAVSYFESENIKIQLFQDCTNDEFKAICKKELNSIRDVESKGNNTAYNPFESKDLLKFKIQEHSINDFNILFDDKFNEAKEQGYLTDKYFAKNELNRVDIYYKQCFEWFPIFKQWTEFLNVVIVKGKIKVKKSKEATNNFTDRQVALAYFIMGTKIDEANYEGILNKHSQSKSKRILTKLFTKTNQIKPLNETKKGYTEHLKDLKAAKRLLDGIKNKIGLNAITPIINAFQTTYDLKF